MTWEQCDPRAKLALALGMSLAILLAGPARAVLLLAPAIALAATALDRRQMLGLLRTVLIIWGITVLVNGFLVPGTRLGPEALGWFRPTVEGIRAGLVQGFRLTGLAAVSGWAIATGRALDLASSFEWAARKRPGLRRRIHRGLFPMVLALRLVPLLVDEAVRLVAVDRLRGGPPLRGPAGVRRLARLGPAWITLILDRADQLALAMTLRGYRPDRDMVLIRSYDWRAGDWALATAGAGAVILAAV